MDDVGDDGDGDDDGDRLVEIGMRYGVYAVQET